MGRSELIGVELQRSEIRRFKGVRFEMQISMFGSSAVQSSELRGAADQSSNFWEFTVSEMHRLRE